MQKHRCTFIHKYENIKLLLEAHEARSETPLDIYAEMYTSIHKPTQAHVFLYVCIYIHSMHRVLHMQKQVYVYWFAETKTHLHKHKNRDSFIGRYMCFKHVLSGIFMLPESHAYTHRGIVIIKTHIHKHAHTCIWNLSVHAHHQHMYIWKCTWGTHENIYGHGCTRRCAHINLLVHGGIYMYIQTKHRDP